jgi:pyruvate/2-oxoglutarate dehydrogenase complex dihydrolipoamide dehydrogenase (E3) component
MRKFDVVILGAGSSGEVIASSLAKAGKSVALIEEARVGGECPYVACIPSKAMLESSRARQNVKDLQKSGGSSIPLVLDDDETAFAFAAARRDQIAEHRDDQGVTKRLLGEGVVIVRGRGRIVRPEVVGVGEEEFGYSDLVISTGSSSNQPPIEGIGEIEAWTSDEALSTNVRPSSALIIGGGPVGCELAQMFARFGTRTFLVEASDQLAGKEHLEVAGRLSEVLKRDGVRVKLSTSVVKLSSTPERTSYAVLSDGFSVDVERVIISVGRHPNSADLGLELIGVGLNEDGSISVDKRCRVNNNEHVWAAGDVTGIAPFTHTANYQARIISDNILGHIREANYVAIPRAIYTDPPVASVGRMMSSEDKKDLITARYDLDETARTTTDSGPGGVLILTADSKRKVLVGAAAIGPKADEWLAEATLAIRAEISLKILGDVVHAFPTYGECFEPPIRDLLNQISQ